MLFQKAFLVTFCQDFGSGMICVQHLNAVFGIKSHKSALCVAERASFLEL